MKSRIVFITLALLVLSSCKFLVHPHLQNADSGNLTDAPGSSTNINVSAATESGSNQYYQSLLEKQSKLKDALALLNNQTQYLHNTLQKLQGLPEISIVALEDVLADELNILSDMASDHKLPFEAQQVNCSNITTGDIAVFQASVTQIQHDLSEINQQIQQIRAEDSQGTSQGLIEQLELEAQWVQNYLNKLKSTVNSLKECPQESTTSPQDTAESQPTIVYINNPDAVNWIYGDLTPSQYYIQMLDYISNNRRTTCQIAACPIGTPYLIQNFKSDNQTDQAIEEDNTTQFVEQCSQCPDGFPLYDVSLKKCVICSEEDGMIFVEEQHMCVRPQNQSNNGAVTGNQNVIVCDQHPQMIYNSSTGKCQCPQKNSFFNGKQCILCELPSFWNEELKECQQCPNNASFFYNIKAKKCEECPAEKPLSKGIECSACALNEFFNAETLVCQQCEGNKYYNPIHSQCQCQQDTPFYNGTVCSACPIYQQYSNETKKCTECLSDREFYNISTGKCYQCPEDTPVGNMDFCLGCPEDTIFDKDLWVCQPCNGEGMKLVQVDGEKKCTCPASAPYLNVAQNKCLSCYLPKFWNETSNSCESCPDDMIYSRQAKKCTICPETAPIVENGRCTPCPDRTHFNFTTGTCMACPGSLLYVESARVCVIPKCQEGAEWNQQELKCLSICKGKSSYNFDSKSCVCPETTPYYNNIQCLACYLPKHWDVQKLECTACANEQYFNLTLQKCVYCGYHERFNGDRYRCEPICDVPSFYNQTKNECDNCPKGMVYSPEHKVCGKCPAGAQLIIEGRCFACPNGTYYEYESNKCLACPDDSFYNPNLQTCVKKCGGDSYYSYESNKCKCPADIPFYDGQRCRQCYFPKYWQVDTQSCQYCPPEQYFNTSQGKCVPCQAGQQLILANDSVKCEFIIPECPYPMYYDLEHHACSNCPRDTIYSVLDDKCVKCPVDRPIVLNNQCVYCPVDTNYDSINKKCVKCRQNEEIFSKQLSRCIPQCRGQSTYNNVSSKCECPAYRPYYDGSNCVACYLPKYWDIVSHSCQYCPTEKYFSSEVSKCVECKEGYHLSKDSYTCQKITPICIFPKYLDKNSLECVECSYKDGFIYDFTQTQQCVKCPEDKPLILNYQCAACEQNSFYDKIRKVCVRCTAGTKYLRQSNVCEPICTALSQAFNPDTNNCQCTESNSYLNTVTKQCEKCELPRFWDYLSNTCRNCADQNSHYNVTIQKCYACPFRYRFDLASYACVFDETVCQYDRQQFYNYTQKKCICPQDKSFFTSSHICVSCGAGDKNNYEYWNQNKQECIICQQGMHYESLLNACVTCPKGMNYNSKLAKCENICPTSAIYIEKYNKCQCIEVEQHWNGDHCVRCATDKQQFWMDALNSCIRCPTGSFFSQQLGKCASCPEGFSYNITQKLCTKTVTQDSCAKYTPRTLFNPVNNTCQCPQQTPFFSSKDNTCLRCEEDYNTYWDIADQKCHQCPVNQHFDISRHGCFSCETGSAFDVENLRCMPLVTTGNICTSSQLFFNQLTKKCECLEASRPYFNGESCVSCDLPRFWNQATKNCEKCATGMHYDTLQKACVTCKQGETFNSAKNICEAASQQMNVNPIFVQPISTTPTTQIQNTVSINATSVNPIPSSWTAGQGAVTTVEPTISVSPISSNTSSVTTGASGQCSKLKPYWDKQAGQCVGCYLPKYWNHDTQTCQSCPPNNNYDVLQKRCVVCASGYKFDYLKYQCVAAGTNITTNVVNSNNSSNNVTVTPITNDTPATTIQSTTKCPDSQPFWNGQKCISCYLPQYWNTFTLKCESCETGKNYDIGLKKCIQCTNGYNFTTFKCN